MSKYLIFLTAKLKTMRKLALLSIFLFVAAITAFAQQPVNWSFDAKPLNGGQYEVTFTADVEDGWYIYSQHLDDGGPIPTSFTFDNKEKFTFVGETAETGKRKAGFDEIFEMELVKFAGKVQFKQVVKASEKGESVKGYLEYMTCNDDQCLPPTEVAFSIPLK